MHTIPNMGTITDLQGHKEFCVLQITPNYHTGENLNSSATANSRFLGNVSLPLHLSVHQLRNLQFENLLPKITPHSTVCHDFAINRHTVARQLPESPSHETDACLHEKKLGKKHIKH